MSKESLYKEENATSEDGLLESQDDLDSVELDNAPRLKQKSRKRSGSFRVLVFSHLVALVLYSAIFFAASRHYVRKFAHGPDLIYCSWDVSLLEVDRSLTYRDFQHRLERRSDTKRSFSIMMFTIRMPSKGIRVRNLMPPGITSSAVGDPASEARMRDR